MKVSIKEIFVFSLTTLLVILYAVVACQNSLFPFTEGHQGVGFVSGIVFTILFFSFALPYSWADSVNRIENSPVVLVFLGVLLFISGAGGFLKLIWNVAYTVGFTIEWWVYTLPIIGLLFIFPFFVQRLWRKAKKGKKGKEK